MVREASSRDQFTNKNPGYQIAFYIQHTGLPWGILTNGRLWRLYHKDSAHKLDRYYEINLSELVAARVGFLRLTVAVSAGYTLDMPAPEFPLRRFVPQRTGDANPLGKLESTVMEAVWNAAVQVTVGNVHEVLPQDRPVTYNTVKTTMERLADKGILTRVKHGKAYRYAPAVTREELERRIVTNALDRLVAQFPEAVASFFVRPGADVTEEKLGLLMEAIERKREAADA